MAPSTQAVATVPEILSAASLYHRSSQLAAAIVAGIADPNFKARLLTLGGEANPFGQFIADEIAKWPKVIKLPTSSRSDPSQHSVASDGRIPQHNIAFGSGAAVLAASADRPLLLQLQAPCRVEANSGSVQ